jgi:hypothetical protein
MGYKRSHLMGYTLLCGVVEVSVANRNDAAQWLLLSVCVFRRSDFTDFLFVQFAN